MADDRSDCRPRASESLATRSKAVQDQQGTGYFSIGKGDESNYLPN